MRGVDMNRHRKSKILNKVITKEVLIKEYSINKISTWKIAGKYNCSKSFILKYLNKYNIKRRNKSTSQLGKIVSKETIRKISLANTGKISSFKGKKHSEKSKKLISESQHGRCGELANNWQGGLSRYGYPWYFNNELKNKIRKRDNFTCKNCNKNEELFYRKLDVHHIDYNKENCNENNLITLCIYCHLKTNTNRDYWYAYYRYIIENNQ